MEISLPNFWKVGISPKHNLKEALQWALFFMLGIFFLCACEKPDESAFRQDLKVAAYGFESYQGTREFQTDASYEIPYAEIQEISIFSSDAETGAQVKISGAFFGPYSFGTQDTIIVFFSGGFGNLDYYYSRIQLLKSISPHYKVLTFDYQGIGKSAGEFSFSNIQNDGEAILSWIKSRAQNSTVCFYAAGLGSIALMPHNVMTDSMFFEAPKVILENPFAHSELMVSNAVQFNWSASYTSVTEIDLLSIASDQKGNFLMLVSELDERLNPEDHGQALFSAINQPMQLVEVSEAGHHSIPVLLGYSDFIEKLHNFLKQ